MLWQANVNSVLATSKHSYLLGYEAKPHVQRVGRVSVPWSSSKRVTLTLSFEKGRVCLCEKQAPKVWLGRRCCDRRRALQPAAASILLGGSGY